jgi:preprotein translocase subunit SecA
MASRDPLVEYQREGFELFKVMMEAIREESIGFIFNVEVQLDEVAPEQGGGSEEHPVILAKGLDAPERPTELHYSAPTIDGDQAEIHFDEHFDLDLDGDEESEAASGMPGNRAERRAARHEKG